jgi:mono/diheme cytochrome c family protein
MRRFSRLGWVLGLSGLWACSSGGGPSGATHDPVKPPSGNPDQDAGIVDDDDDDDDDVDASIEDPEPPTPPPAFPPGPWGSGFPIDGEPQDLGDPKLGRDLILNGGYMGCGIPMRLVDNPLIGPFIGGALGPASTDQKISGRNAKNDKLPYSRNVFTSTDGVEVTNVGCLMCHAGSFNGELILGLGTADSDFTAGFGAGNGMTSSGGIPAELTALLGMNKAETDNLNKMLTRSAAFTDITAMRTRGQNPAEAMAIALMAHHNEDLSWSDAPVVPWEFTDHDGNKIKPEPFPSDPPPWWRAKKKNALFYNGMARGDHSGSMALATSLCVDNDAQAEKVGELFKHMHAYVLTLEAPKYPFAIDQQLADRGKEVFTANCAGCHGTYGKSDADDWYPNLLFPLSVIGTDAVIAEGGVVYAPEMVALYNKTFYGKTTPFICDDPTVGYMAPPLDGVWATGPFLHNGSVPTIELVLNSKARPTYWKRLDFDSKHFDEVSLGWPFEVMATGQEGTIALDAKHIYDTTKFGQANGGHAFGDHLTGDERRAVIEYLKTL